MYICIFYSQKLLDRGHVDIAKQMTLIVNELWMQIMRYDILLFVVENCIIGMPKK